MAVILFDGQCNLCSGAVRWIIERDPKEYFQFASLQSPKATELLSGSKLLDQTDSIVLIEKGNIYTQSEAALRIARNLRQPWSWLYALRFIPASIRNVVYRLVARKRYAWFGKNTTCSYPNDELAKRFL